MMMTVRTLVTGELKFSKDVEACVHGSTPGWAAAIKQALYRHQRCDWGMVDSEDKQLNDAAWIHDRLIVSTYIGPGQERFHLMTEGDRRVTRVALCGETP